MNLEPAVVATPTIVKIIDNHSRLIRV